MPGELRCFSVGEPWRPSPGQAAVGSCRRRVIAGLSQGLGQAGREPGSGDRAGVSSGAGGGLRFLPAAWQVWGYQPARLPSLRDIRLGVGGRGWAQGRPWHLVQSPQAPWGDGTAQTELTGSPVGQGSVRVCPSGRVAGPGMGNLWGKSSSSSQAGNSDGQAGPGCPLHPTPHPLSPCTPQPPLILHKLAPKFCLLLLAPLAPLLHLEVGM